MMKLKYEDNKENKAKGKTRKKKMIKKSKNNFFSFKEKID